MLNRIFTWFETRIDPFARDVPISQPPDRLLPFFWYFLKPVWWAFALLTSATLILAGLEVAVMAFVGRIVDMMKDAQTPSTFFADHWVELTVMAVLALVVRPVMSTLADLFKQQMIQGPVNIRVRWLAHRYVLRQSLGYFQNDFAGRVATRVMPARSRRARCRRQHLRRRGLGGRALDRRVHPVLRRPTGGSPCRCWSGSPATSSR